MVNLALVLRERNDLSQARELLEGAAPHHQAALKANPENPTYRHYFQNNRALLATTLAALGDHVGASQTAEQLAALSWNPALNAFNAACALAQCIPAVQKDSKLPETKREELAESYAQRALVMLRQSMAKGFRDVARLKKDIKLNPLRKLPEFDELVIEMDAKAKSTAK
jgi:hypothetical protein